ncbi:IclR family transcriptional regulator [Modestobacter lapidis]|nr:IclR family transcriptional regulator [Modestobacter lapidis]
MANSPTGDSVLARIVRVLDSFEDGAPLTASQVARRADLPVATAHRLAVALVSHGLLERAPDGRLRVGVRLWELAARAPRALGLREAAMPFMEDVHAATRQHVQLSVLEGDDVLFIERLSARNAVINLVTVGGRIPAHASSSGLVMLAFAPPGRQEEVLARPMRPYTAATIIDPNRLRRELAEVRRVGYAVTGGHVHRDATGIAVPVHGSGNAVVAALAVVVPSADAQPRQHVSALLAAARGISRTLGAALPTPSAERLSSPHAPAPG